MRFSVQTHESSIAKLPILALPVVQALLSYQSAPFEQLHYASNRIRHLIQHPSWPICVICNGNNHIERYIKVVAMMRIGRDLKTREQGTSIVPGISVPSGAGENQSGWNPSTIAKRRV